MLKALHDPQDGVLYVVGLMSGSGTNLRRILEHEQNLNTEGGGSPFRIVAIFSDRADSQASAIGKDFDRPVLIRDIGAFYRQRGRPRNDLVLRAEFDAATVAMLSPFKARAAVYAGYMSIATKPLIEAFLGINVHPADLAVELDGRRCYVGDHAVRDAIVAGETVLRATTHLIEPEVDGGRLLMRSPAINVELPEGIELSTTEGRAKAESHNQERLKRAGDWVVFPATLEALARGRFAQDEQGRLYFDGQPAFKGVAL